MPNPVFSFSCPGHPNNFTKLVLRNRVVNQQVVEICPRPFIRMAYNNYRGVFGLDEDNKMVEYPWNHHFPNGFHAQPILQSFFDKHNLIPSWTDCKEIWGGLNETTGLWNGALGEVSLILDLFMTLC